MMNAANIFTKGLTTAAQNYKDHAMKASYLDGQAGMLAEQGYLTPDDLDAFVQGNVGKKEGIVTQGLAKQKFGEQEQMLNMQFGQRAGLAAHEAEMNRFTPDPAALDAAARSGHTFLPQSNRGGTWVRDPSAEQPLPTYEPTPQDIQAYQQAGYAIVRDPATGEAKAVPDRTITQQTQDALASTYAKQDREKMASLAAEIAKLDVQIAESGPDSKFGPNWNPLAATRAERRAALAAEMEVLQQAPTSRAAVPGFADDPLPPSLPPPAPTPTPAELDALSSSALFGGELSLPVDDALPPAAPRTPGADPATKAALDAARAAIAQGASLEAVAAHLRANGIDPLLLELE